MMGYVWSGKIFFKCFQRRCLFILEVVQNEREVIVGKKLPECIFECME